MSSPISNVRPAPDRLLTDLADYALGARITSNEALDTARWCLADTLACGIMALAYPACTKLLGPVVPGTTIACGARVPGTSHELDPVQAAFNLGTIVRWKNDQRDDQSGKNDQRCENPDFRGNV